MRISLSILFLCLVVTVRENDAHFKKSRRFGSRSDIDDERHLAEHLAEEIGDHEMDPEERFFHYFMLQDTNGDLALDGLELGKSMLLHSHEGEVLEHVTDAEFEQRVDDALANFDTDNDGVVHFHEFRAVSELHRTLNA